MSRATTLGILALAIVYAAAQTVYIDIDTGQIVGIDQGKKTQGYPQQGVYPNYGVQRPQTVYPNYQPTYPQNQRPHQRPQYPHQPQYPRQPQYPQQQMPQQPQQGNMANSLNAEWVCRNTKTGDTMIIASEGGVQKQSQTYPPPNSQNQQNPQNPYQDNPWLKPQTPEVPQQNTPPIPQQPDWSQTTPNRVQEISTPPPPPPPTTTRPTTTPPPPTAPTTKSPFPTLDNIDWTQYIDKTTKEPPSQGLKSAIDGEGVIEPRTG